MFSLSREMPRQKIQIIKTEKKAVLVPVKELAMLNIKIKEPWKPLSKNYELGTML